MPGSLRGKQTHETQVVDLQIRSHKIIASIAVIQRHDWLAQSMAIKYLKFFHGVMQI